VPAAGLPTQARQRKFESSSKHRANPPLFRKAMSSMSNLDVEIAMDCLVVNIERPWLHAELFLDSDLDVGKE
jgi:hypothetical protein